MKASELRIDNYIELFRKPSDMEKTQHQIKNIDTSNGLVELYDSFVVNYASGISPIPLTEQWLKDFGFRYNHNDYVLDEWIFVEIEDGNWEDPCLDFLIKTSDMGIPFYIRSIEYVHQLQNLYFTLTGEELTKQ